MHDPLSTYVQAVWPADAPNIDGLVVAASGLRVATHPFVSTLVVVLLS